MAGAHQPPRQPVPAAVVGNSFVKQYYGLLAREPKKLYRFYKDHSVFSRGEEGAYDSDVFSAIGQHEIHNHIMEMVGDPSQYEPGSACKAEIQGIESQESRQGGVLVLVTGSLTFSRDPAPRYFTQAFFLDKQTEPYDGYFVLNDILRYLTKQPSQDLHFSQEQQHGLMPPPAAGLDASTAMMNHPGSPQHPASAPPSAQVESSNGTMAHGSYDDSQKEEHYNEEEEYYEEEEAAEDAAEEAEAEAAPEEHVSHDVDIPPEEPEVPGLSVGDFPEMPGSAPMQEAPQRSWAAMASGLRSGGGGIAPARQAGFAYTGGPPPASKAGAGAAATGPSNSTPEATEPPSSTTATGQVKLWLSRLPADENLQDSEVLSVLNDLLTSGAGRAVEVERRDATKEWAHVIVSTPEAADSLVQFSKERKLVFKGKPLKIEYPRNSGGGQGANPSGGQGAAERGDRGNSWGQSQRGGKGRGDGKGKGRTRGSDEGPRAEGDDSAGRGRQNRRGGGEKGSGGAEGAARSGDGAGRSRGGGRKPGQGGAGKGQS